MTAVNFVLNCAGLLLWLNWCSRSVAVPRPAGIALVSTLRRAEPARRERWRSLGLLGVLLFVRAMIYWQIGAAFHWTPRLSLSAISIAFPTEHFGAMLLFSLLSFLAAAAVFYFSLLLLSAANHKLPLNDPTQSYVRLLLGRIDRLPPVIKLVLPVLLAAMAWVALGPLLAAAGVLVPAVSFLHWVEQGALIGLGAWLSWKYLLIAVLMLHIVTSYVYFGNAPMWNFVGVTARNLLGPFSRFPLRVGKIDLAPVAALILFCSVIQALEFYKVLPNLFVKLPL